MGSSEVDNAGPETSGDDGAEKPVLPGWAKQPHEDFLAHSKEIYDVLHMACAGIADLKRLPESLELDDEISDFLGEERRHDPTHHEEAKRQADLAKRELENGFRLLHAQALTSLWSGLEVYVENLLAAWLHNEPSARDTDAVRKVRIRLWEYDTMDTAERSLYTIQLLQKEVTGPLTVGVTGFEAQLQLFGLADEVEAELRREIFEASHVRNVLVHRRGVADRRLIQSCPWLGLELGQQVPVGHEEFGRLGLAIIHYEAAIHDRIRRHFGLEPRVPGILATISDQRKDEPENG